MKVRIQTFWNVPLFCMAASWITYNITVRFGGYFYTVKAPGIDGMIYLSADPLRSAIFHGVLFLIVLLVGGLLVFRSMTKREIAISAGIASGIYLLIVLAQLCMEDFPLAWSLRLSYIHNWPGIVASFLMKLTDHLPVSAIVSSFAPMLFIPFGRKSN